MYSCANLMAQSFLELDCGVFSTVNTNPKSEQKPYAFLKLVQKSNGTVLENDTDRTLYNRWIVTDALFNLEQNEPCVRMRYHWPSVIFFFQNSHMSTEIEYFLELLTNGPYSGIAPKWTSLRIRSREYYIQEFLGLKRFSVFPSKPSVFAI